MILLFTGAKDEELPQPEPRLSIGGYISNSQIPNASLNNLFGEISQYTLEKQVIEYRGIALKNTTVATITGAKLFYENLSNDPLVNIRMAVTTPAQDACGWFIEKVANINSRPLNATFVDNRTLLNAIDLPAINPGGYVGIWIERSFNASAIATTMSCSALFAAFLAVPINQISTVTTVADVADSLNNTYWYLDTPQNKFVVWYDTGTGAMPNIPDREPIRVVIVTGDTADDVALKTTNQLNSLLTPRGEISATVLTNVITITNIAAGLSATPSAETSGFTTAVTTVGVTGGAETIEDIALTVSW